MSLTPLTIEERTPELAALHAEVFGKPEEKSQKQAHAGRGSANGHTHPLSDEEIILLATRAKNGALFACLYAGDTTGYPSPSEADQALCNLLTFYCGPDPLRIDRLFRQSGLYRPKWDKKHFSDGRTYGQATIEKALAGAREFYLHAGTSSDATWPSDADAPPEREDSTRTHARERVYRERADGEAQEQSPSSQTEDDKNTDSDQKSTPEAWPVLAEEALYGLAGDIVRTIDPFTEADPVAVLLNVLTAFGNCINVSAHARVQHDRHPARLFVVQVGDTSKGRKGTGWSTPRYLFSLVDLDWAKSRVKSGLSSGEGLIYNVRDPRSAKVPIKEKGRFTGEYDEICADEGEEDKRLLVIEPEFASTLTVMNRDGNTLSTTIRQAWDSGDLSPLTKNNPTKATNAHISIIGHITKQELLARLDDTSKANGFANRFLWVLVRRSKELPEGAAVPEEVLQSLAERLSEVITFSRTVSERGRSQGGLLSDCRLTACVR